MERTVQFDSGGISIAGTYYVNDHPLAKMPGIVLAHGFAGARYPKMASFLAERGYGVLAFDFRGYGLSGGERGRVIPAEQVVDIRSAVTWLSNTPEIDPAQIGIVGSSLGGSIAIMAAAEDGRVAACVAGCPLGKGDSPMRMQYDTEEKFAAFLKKVEEKKRQNQRLQRFEIVFIPEKLRSFLPQGTPMEFSADTVYGFLAMKPMEAVSRIAPRPLLIIHAKDDHVVPVEDACALAARAGNNCDLDLIDAGDHFIFGAQPVIQKIADWLQRHLPTGRIAAKA
jgi:alpha-beta hydrolase superfamily lysophospholipase